MADMSFHIASILQLFQLLHLVHTYGHGLYELSRMIMRKNVNNHVSKDSPTPKERNERHPEKTLS